jgi:hypothetical protein
MTNVPIKNSLNLCYAGLKEVREIEHLEAGWP